MGIAALQSIRESQMCASAFSRQGIAPGDMVFAMKALAIPSGPYRIAIHRAKGCYFAQVIDLPGCVARGASEVEAVENARATIRAYLWVAQVLAGDEPTIRLEISA
jgi:predicted RNase H-like HicB family nuclease